jgi:hypothetical protein
VARVGGDGLVMVPGAGRATGAVVSGGSVVTVDGMLVVIRGSVVVSGGSVVTVDGMLVVVRGSPVVTAGREGRATGPGVALVTPGIAAAPVGPDAPVPAASASELAAISNAVAALTVPRPTPVHVMADFSRGSSERSDACPRH